MKEHKYVQLKKKITTTLILYNYHDHDLKLYGIDGASHTSS